SQAIFERFCAVMFGRTWAGHAQSVSNAVSQATTTLDSLSKSFQPYAGQWGPSGRSIRASRSVLLDFATTVYEDLLSSGRDAAIRPLLDCGLSKVEVVDEILTQIVAGTETTTITTCWALSLLARHPEARAQVREGALDVDLCVNETLRMYPAFWTMIRVAKRDVLLEGQQIKKDTVLFVSPFCVHHNPAFWPDPERFDPQRFVDRISVRGDFMPYGYGARACLGGRLAHVLIRECVLQASTQLDLALCEDEPHGQQVDPLIVVLKSQTGFRFNVAWRGKGDERQAQEAPFP
ncbi:MAG: cytochrome P450, partial [Cognaticolwellia sp.]